MFVDYEVTVCLLLSAHGSGSLLSRREELLVGLPERGPQQSLPKVLNTDVNTELGLMLLLLLSCFRSFRKKLYSIFVSFLQVLGCGAFTGRQLRVSFRSEAQHQR